MKRIKKMKRKDLKRILVKFLWTYFERKKKSYKHSKNIKKKYNLSPKNKVQLKEIHEQIFIFNGFFFFLHLINELIY